MTRAGPALAILSVVAVIVIVAVVLVRAFVPVIPGDAPAPLVARTVLAGEIAPDASEGVDPDTIPRSPVGQECLASIERAAGPLSLCWEAYRDPFDSDPVSDYYNLRVHGTFGGETGTGVRWVAVRVRLVGEPSKNVAESWPEGVFDGGCQEVAVTIHSLGPSPASSETLCGQTTGTTNRDDWSHRVTWSCNGCLVPDHADRAITLREFVAVPAGTIPAWEIFADLGS